MKELTGLCGLLDEGLYCWWWLQSTKCWYEWCYWTQTTIRSCVRLYLLTCMCVLIHPTQHSSRYVSASTHSERALQVQLSDSKVWHYSTQLMIHQPHPLYPAYHHSAMAQPVQCEVAGVLCGAGRSHCWKSAVCYKSIPVTCRNHLYQCSATSVKLVSLVQL